MDIKAETEKIGSNVLLRYAVLFLGLLVLFLSEGVLTWKQTSERDAAGNVAKIQHQINTLERDIAYSDDSGDKKDMREEIKDLKENDLVDARMEAAGESVDAKNGIWLWSMVHLKGVALVSLGLLVIAASGGTHEKIGALVALGLVITRL